MAKRSKKQTRKIRNLVVVCSLCAIVLTVSTYAWFIGMKTVNVSTFDIDIATTEGLFLSMDGTNWYYNLDAKNAPVYEGNTNTWATNGLIPVSTVGDMDSDVSRMKLYEKASLTTSSGGYRLLSSRVRNYKNETTGQLMQGDGYVAFDLFIKNLSGAEYYTENNKLNEEAIFLTTNSSVTVASDGGAAGTGIENSVRVAFAQIGRVKGDTTNADNITKISCSDVEASGTTQVQVTGICRSAQIWEPNDKDHVQNAINWYDTACSTRKSTGTDITSKDSYNVGTKCATVSDDVATYAVSRDIIVGDNVDIYDGAAYNTYEANTVDYKTYAKNVTATASDEIRNQYKLVDFPYFTDTMKKKTGNERPEFMTLAPNSITKVRVYIYIEGQDIDNYDFASLGKKISINFGFTKERYSQSDFPAYDGPSTDITPTHSDEIIFPNKEVATPAE